MYVLSSLIIKRRSWHCLKHITIVDIVNLLRLYNRFVVVIKMYQVITEQTGCMFLSFHNVFSYLDKDPIFE